MKVPVTSVLCTVELSKLLHLDVDSCGRPRWAHHWGVSQTKPHNVLDDACVLASILAYPLARSTALSIPLPLRSPRTLQLPTFADSTTHAA